MWTRASGIAKVSIGSLGVLFVIGQILGCALTSKADPIDTRYFEPEPPHPSPTAVTPKAATTAPLELQLGRVSASAYLKSRLVYRTSSFELGAYDDRQWTERPEEYLRRALSSALFDDRGITHALSGTSPTLDVELVNFEELRSANKSSGRVTIRYAVRDDRTVWMSDSITVDQPTEGGSRKPEKVVAAISKALASATSTLADKVEARLKEPAPKAVSTAAN